MFAFIPLLALMAVLGGGVTLIWYEELSEAEKLQADLLASGYAKKLFNKSLEELTQAASQARVPAHAAPFPELKLLVPGRGRRLSSDGGLLTGWRARAASKRRSKRISAIP